MCPLTLTEERRGVLQRTATVEEEDEEEEEGEDEGNWGGCGRKVTEEEEESNWGGFLGLRPANQWETALLCNDVSLVGRKPRISPG